MWWHVHRNTNEHEYKLVKAQLRVHTFQPIFLHLCPFYITADWNPFLWIINGPFWKPHVVCLHPRIIRELSDHLRCCPSVQTHRGSFFAVSQSTCTLTCTMSLLVLLHLSFTWVALRHVHLLRASRRTWKLIDTKTIKNFKIQKIIKGKNAVVCEFVCHLWAAGSLVAAVLTHCVLAHVHFFSCLLPLRLHH